MTSPHDASQDPNAGGDAALRALYQDAQTHVSSGTTARLHRGRHAALQAPSRRRNWGWPVASATAAMFALAIGMQFVAPPAGDPADAAPPVVVATVVDENVPVADGIDEAVAAYDESPDFYLWLAANEATLLAAE